MNKPGPKHMAALNDQVEGLITAMSYRYPFRREDIAKLVKDLAASSTWNTYKAAKAVEYGFSGGATIEMLRLSYGLDS